MRVIWIDERSHLSLSDFEMEMNNTVNTVVINGTTDLKMDNVQQMASQINTISIIFLINEKLTKKQHGRIEML